MFEREVCEAFIGGVLAARKFVTDQAKLKELDASIAMAIAGFEQYFGVEHVDSYRA